MGCFENSSQSHQKFRQRLHKKLVSKTFKIPNIPNLVTLDRTDLKNDSTVRTKEGIFDILPTLNAPNQQSHVKMRASPWK